MTVERSRENQLPPDYVRWPEVEQNESLKTAIEASLYAGELLRDAFNQKYDTALNPDSSDFTPFDKQAEIRARSIIQQHEPDAKFSSEELSPDFDISEGNFWTIDGIDGTTNFKLRIPIVNFTLAKVEGGTTQVGVVYDFLHNDLYYAVKDKGAFRNGEKIEVSSRPFKESVISFAPLRYYGRDKWDEEKAAVEATRAGMDEITDVSGRFHRELQSGGLELAWIAEGRLDGFASSWTSPWDLSAGVLLVREAGGIVTNIYGEDWQPSFKGVIAGNREIQPQMLSIIQKHFKK
ncbi:MAG TPA: inositol monophosphatase [Patescibacteria group bacterium]|nr:inositol monophosphatase [Patescibacteria group bacterium]